MFYKARQLMVAQIPKSEFLIGIKRKHLQFSCACHCNQEACKTRIKTKKFNEARMTAVESEHEMTQLSPLTAWFQMQVLTEHQTYSHYQINSGEGNGTPLQYSCLESPMDGGAWWAAFHGVAKSRTRLSRLHFHFSLSCIGEGNGNSLQCSCLENPRDREAWQAAVYGVAQSRTGLK